MGRGSPAGQTEYPSSCNHRPRSDKHEARKKHTQSEANMATQVEKALYKPGTRSTHQKMYPAPHLRRLLTPRNRLLKPLHLQPNDRIIEDRCPQTRPILLYDITRNFRAKQQTHSQPPHGAWEDRDARVQASCPKMTCQATLRYRKSRILLAKRPSQSCHE